MEVRQTAEFEEWFLGLRDRAARMRINQRLLRLSEGNSGDTASVGMGISELRVHYGPGYRIYYARRDDAYVVLCGGDKSTQVRDIRRASRLAEGL